MQNGAFIARRDPQRGRTHVDDNMHRMYIYTHVCERVSGVGARFRNELFQSGGAAVKGWRWRSCRSALEHVRLFSGSGAWITRGTRTNRRELNDFRRIFIRSLIPRWEKKQISIRALPYRDYAKLKNSVVVDETRNKRRRKTHVARYFAEF